MDEYYNRHYITVAENGDITDGWSDGPRPERDASGAILLTGKGGYQFRIFGEENPALRDDNGICLYRWTCGTVRAKTADEIAKDMLRLPAPESIPSQEERISAMEAAMIDVLGMVVSL